MTVDYIEEVAKEKGLRGEAHEEYERLLELVIDKDQVFRMWNNIFLVSTGLFMWFVMFTCVMFALSLETEYELYLGMGWFLAVVLMITFFAFMLSMFQSQKHQRELSAYEARALAYLESH